MDPSFAWKHLISLSFLKNISASLSLTDGVPCFPWRILSLPALGFLGVSGISIMKTLMGLFLLCFN